MDILITGATGFIASQITTSLINSGHNVTCCVRNVAHASQVFPCAKIIRCNFFQDKKPEDWYARLENIDVVINCVGIFSHPSKEKMWDIHYHTPKALFDACVKMQVKKIIHFSALGIENVKLPYTESKKAAENYLQNLLISSIILRPSLVYGKGSYGGTSLFRGFAGLPIIPVPGKGEQIFQPIHVEDLSRAVINLLSTTEEKIILDAVSAEKINLKNVLLTLRNWLGFAKTKIFSVPLWMIRIGSLFGNFIPYSSMNMTAYKLLLQNNITSEQATKNFQDHIGFTPRNFSSGLFSIPSTVQDHWHARLYFLKPCLRLSLAFLWIYSAVCSVFLFPKNESYQLLQQIGITAFWQPFFLYGASVLDAFFGFATLFNYKMIKIGISQILVILIYSFCILWWLPNFWLHPFAPIAKNIPIIIAILILMALESDR